MFKLIIATFTFYSTVSFACKLGPNSDWNLSEEELAQHTKTIVLGSLETANEIKGTNHVDLKFRILEVKKGKYSDKFITIKDVEKTDSDLISYGKACNFEFDYKMHREYLIYVDAMNPHAIKLIPAQVKTN